MQTVQFKINWTVQFKINWIVFARTFSLALNKLNKKQKKQKQKKNVF